MANSTDPFGASIFGSSGGSTPGTTSMGTSTPASTSTADTYKYKGQGWNDPLAQQMYLKYAFGGRPGAISSDTVSRLAHMGDVSGSGTGGVSYHNPMDPKEWGGSVRGQDVENMKAAYLAAGGQGTYDQLAATDPKSVGWPTDAAGNPLPKMGSTGQTLYPSGSQGFQPPASGSAQAMGGSGSTNSLSPEILKKMWR
jgi:hypothetical protein